MVIVEFWEDVRALGQRTIGGGVWAGIMKVEGEIDRLRVEFTSSCVGILGNGRDIRFWVDRCMDSRRLCDISPGLYHLDRRKDVRVQRIENNAKTLPRGGHISKWVPPADVAADMASYLAWDHMPRGTTQVVTRGKAI
ncbi:hypothetical protein Tco_0730964 [Tanacetum coccineum]